MKKTPEKYMRGDQPSTKVGKPKNVAPSSSTGGKGYRFENRVQATKLLAMCIGGPTAGLPDDSRVIELRFQARVHGRFTDDLVCTVENGAGQRSRALMQMKSGLTARRSDANFKQAVGNAWLDYQSDDFAKSFDVLLIVHDMATKSQMRGAEAVATSARSSLNYDDWRQKLFDAGSGNEPKRNAYTLIKEAVDLYAGRDCGPDELQGFLAHVYFLAQDLDSDITAECKSYLHQIQTASPGHPIRQNAGLVWSKLVTTCMELNEVAGGLDLGNLKDFVGGELSAWFAVHRSFFATGLSSLTTSLPGHHSAARAPASPATVVAVGTAQTLITPTLQEQLPAARDSSTNKLVSAQLDHINTKIKACQYKTALEDIEHLGQDHSLFDAHQKARWHLLRGVCYWHLLGEEDAASEFIQAADLCEDDDKLAAGRARGHLLRKEIPQAVAAAQSALNRFPNSLSAWVALANAQMISGKTLTEADIPPIHRSQADALQLIAFSLKADGRNVEAAKIALKALSLPTSGFFVADASLAITLENAAGDGLKAAFRIFDDASRADLLTAVAAFEPRSQKLWSIQAPNAVAESAARLGMAYLLLDRSEDALAVYQESHARSMLAPSLLRLGIEALAACGKPNEALALGARSVNDMAPEALVAFSQLASNAHDVGAIEGALESATRRGLEQRAINALQALRWDTMLTISELRAAALTEIRQEMNGILAGKSISLLAIAARGLKLYGNRREADHVIERAISLITNDSDAGEIYLVSMVLMQARRFAQAAEFLDRILPKGQISELHTHRLRALLKSGQLAKAQHLIQSFPVGWAADDDARHLAIELGQRAGDWDFLAMLVAPQIDRHPTAAVSWNFKFFVAIHQNEETLPAMVGDAPEIASGSIDELARLASVELTYGDRAKALRRLYRMRRASLDDTEAAAAHLAAHLMQGDELPLLHTVPDSVGPGTSVLLRDSDGQELVRTIDPSECQTLPLTEEFRHVSSEDIRALLGLRVGSRLVIQEKLTSGERAYEVVQIQSAYRRLLDLSGRMTSQSLNPSKIVSMMSIGNDADGKADFSELTRQLQEQATHAAQVFDIYRTSPITLGGVAKMLGRDCIDLVRGWQQQASRLHVGGGDPLEREAAAKLLEGDDLRFVIDAATLAELATIECLECLSLLPHLFVSTRTRDLIAGKLAQVRTARQQGTAFQHEGQLGFSEFTDEDREREIRYYEAIDNAIKHHCDVLPAYGPDDISQMPAELRKVLSGEEFAVVLLSLQEKAHLLSLDARLRNIAGLFATRGVWPQALLRHALQKGAIDARDYSVACLKMFFANRTFISLGPADLTMMAYQGDTWLDVGVRRFAKHISEGEVEFESALRVSMQFLGLLFRAGHCQFGVISQLLEVIVAGLKQHKQCTNNLRAQVAERLTESLEDFGANNSQYIQNVVASTFAALTHIKPDQPLRVSVLKIASPPLIRVRKDVSGATETDKKSSAQSASTASPLGPRAETGTSGVADFDHS